MYSDHSKAASLMTRAAVYARFARNTVRGSSCFF